MPIHERSFRHERQKTAHESSKLKQYGAGALVAAGMFGIPFSVYQVLPPHTQQTHEIKTNDAEKDALSEATYEIAHKYDACSIANLVDTHVRPEQTGLNDAEKRTTLRLTLTVERNNKAAEFLEKYDTNDNVTWTTPQLMPEVFVTPESPAWPVSSPSALNEGYEIPDTSIERNHVDVNEPVSQFTIDVYPYAQQPSDGTVMKFRVETNARAAAAGQDSIDVSTDCSGKAVWDASTQSWSLANS